MKIRITVSKEELQQFSSDAKPYKNKDGSYRLYFNSLEAFKAAIGGDT